MQMIFCNIGWMQEYKGQTEHDTISGGHAYIRKHQTGAEKYNFLPVGDYVYGYVPVRWNDEKNESHKVSINKFGAKSDDESIDDITVIFMAKNPNTNKTYIVGWYKNATLYRQMKQKEFINPKGEIDRLLYVCKTHKNNYVCIPVSKRCFVIPPANKGGYGQSSIWYANNNSELQEKVSDYINNKKTNINNKSKFNNIIIDSEKRKVIEENAVNSTIKFYNEIGFMCEDVSKLNLGWDLRIYNDAEEFYIEVKGTLNKEVNFQLTPNEYKELKNYWRKYRISAVTDCLLEPNVNIFTISFDKKREKYYGLDDKGDILVLEEKTQTYASGYRAK